jgi:drug/metabolite transporter (DMT)-like permease
VSHFSALTPIFLSLTFGLISVAAAKARRDVVGSNEVFRYPPFVGYLMAGFGLVFLCIPFLPPGPRDMPALLWFGFFATFAGLAFAAATYFFRYRVIVDDTTLRFGTLRYRTVPLADVADLDVTEGSRRELRVYLRGGERLAFSNMLGDFGGLISTLEYRIGNRQTAQKLRDQRRRLISQRVLNWAVTLIGACIIVAMTLHSQR